MRSEFGEVLLGTLPFWIKSPKVLLCGDSSVYIKRQAEGPYCGGSCLSNVTRLSWSLRASQASLPGTATSEMSLNADR